MRADRRLLRILRGLGAALFLLALRAALLFLFPARFAAAFPRLALRLLMVFFAAAAAGAFLALVIFFTDFLPGLFDRDRERERERDRDLLERVLEPDLERDRDRVRDRVLRATPFFALGLETWRSLKEAPLLTSAFDFTPRAKATFTCRGEALFVAGCDLR